MANNPYIIIQKWATGSQEIGYFETGGTEIVDGEFKVELIGTYTVYTKLTNGDEYINTLEVAQEDLIIPVPTTSVVEGVVTITYPEGVVPLLQKWDYGEKTISQLESSGFTINDNSFEVSVAGIVTILYVLEGNYKFLYDFIVDESEVPVSDKPIISFVDNVASITIPEGKTAVDLRYTFGKVNSPEDFNQTPMSGYKVYKNNKIFIDLINKGTTKNATLYYKYSDGTEGVKTFAIEDTDGAFQVKTNQTYVNFANGEILTAGFGAYVLLDKEAGLAVDIGMFIEERFDTSYNVKVYTPTASSSMGYKPNVTDFNALPQLQRDKFINKTFNNESEIGNATGTFQARFRPISYHEVSKWIDEIMPIMKLKWINYGGVNRWERLWTRTQASDESAVWAIDENGSPFKINVAYDENKGSKEYEALNINLVQLDVNNMYNGYQSPIDYPYFSPTVTGANSVAKVTFEGKIRYARIGYRDGQRTIEEMRSVNWEFDQGGTFKITQVGWYTIYTRMLDGSDYIEHVYMDSSTMFNFRADHWGTASRVKFTFNNSIPAMTTSTIKWAYGTQTVEYFNNGNTGNNPQFISDDPKSWYTNISSSSEHRVTVYTKDTNGNGYVEIYDIPNEYYNQPVINITWDDNGMVTISPESRIASHIVNKRFAAGSQTLFWFSTNPNNGTVIGASNTLQISQSGVHTFYFKLDNTFDFIKTETINIYPTINIEECKTGDLIEYAGVKFIYSFEDKVMFLQSSGTRQFDSGGSANFDINRTQNIAYWLNNSFYDSIPQAIKDVMIGTSWDIGQSLGADNINCLVANLERYKFTDSVGNDAFKNCTLKYISSSNYYIWTNNKLPATGNPNRRNANSTSFNGTVSATNTSTYVHPVVRFSQGTKVKLLERFQ